jgi:hypothetical protein
LVAISRTEDYRHHWHDVTIGAILGTFCAYFAYRQYYPGLSNESCRDPFLERIHYCTRALDEEHGANSSAESTTGLLNAMDTHIQMKTHPNTHIHADSNMPPVNSHQFTEHSHKYQTENGYQSEGSKIDRNDLNGLSQAAQSGGGSSTAGNNTQLI